MLTVLIYSVGQGHVYFGTKSKCVHGTGSADDFDMNYVEYYTENNGGGNQRRNSTSSDSSNASAKTGLTTKLRPLEFLAVSGCSNIRDVEAF